MTLVLADRGANTNNAMGRATEALDISQVLTSRALVLSAICPKS